MKILFLIGRILLGDAMMMLMIPQPWPYSIGSKRGETR
jgi:hypothetical protein